jgi:signal transduction histidine kinase
MGGSVSVQSAPGEGARFVVRLPISGTDSAVDAGAPARVA